MAEKVLVKIISADKRYRQKAYMSVAIENNDIFLTGQHIDPYDSKTKDNLTTEQMRGLKPMSEAQAKKFGYVINPDIQHPIRHLREYDVSIGPDGSPVNHKDYWEFNYLKYQPVVAKDKDSYNLTENRFYIEDKEAEASKRVTKRELMYKAVELVRKDLSLERLTDIALLLNYHVSTFNVNTAKISRTLLEDKIYETCETNPDEVLKCFTDESELDLYILKLSQKGIITKKGQDFFDGTTFIGKNIEGVKDYMNKSANEQVTNKWSALMKNDVPIASKPSIDTDKEAQMINEGFMALLSKDKAKLAFVYAQLEQMKSKKIQTLKDAEKLAEEGQSDIPALQTLKMEAGRLKIPKEEWDSLSREELYEYIQKYKSEKK
jgi:hypothetical protein